MSKQSKKDDPYLKREQDRYENPVPSREYILQTLEKIGKPAKMAKLCEAFEIDDEERRHGLERRLHAMIRDGQLLQNRRGMFGLTERMDLVRGRLQLTKQGFGFLIPDKRGQADIFLPARQVRGLFDGDKLLVRLVPTKRGKKPEGIVVDALETGETRIVAGRFYQEGLNAFVSADSKEFPQDIVIQHGQWGDAKDKDYVEVELIPIPKKHRQYMGKVLKVLGTQLTPGMEVELAIRTHNIPHHFPDAVIDEAKGLPDQVIYEPSPESRRRDLRDKFFVTIDGEDAKDFDDAVYCEDNGKGWTLWVAIADVSHYVREQTALDQEGEKRGNSVYFPSKVVPMLPEKLSNHLCSLVPHEDRLTMVCEMQINRDGVVKHHEFYKGVIHSHERLTYEKAYQIIQGDAYENPEVLPHVHNLYQLYLKLARQRKVRGAIEFDTLETKIKFDKNGKIEKIEPRYRNEAHMLIEEMMLAANVSAAKFLQKAEIPALYRNHDKPDTERLISLRDFLKPFGLKLTGGKNPTAVDYCKLLARIQNRPDKHLLQTMLLRSMSQANYSAFNIGHFGLAYQEYTHFTSPIRRYPDLLVHRAIKFALRAKSLKGYDYDQEQMEQMGEHCSTTERRTDLATREATDWLKCDYMKDKLGEEFDGVIAETTGFGFFVELKDIYVQGLVHISSLPDDYYHYDAIHKRLTGKHSGKSYRLGDSLRVKVVRVDLDERKIDFDLVAN